MSRASLYRVTFFATLLSAVLSLPFVHMPDGPDKLVHAATFFVYTYLLYEHYKVHTGERKNGKALLGVVLLLGIAGAVYEVMQLLFIPSRTADVYDWLADMAGVMLATAYLRHTDNQPPS